MSTTYGELVQKVLDWSNRDPDIFQASTTVARDAWTRGEAGLIPDFLQYAADKAYRALRVPSLEFARNFCVADEDFIDSDVQANMGGQTVLMPVPDDLIEVIYIRNITKSYVFDEKLDLRTFYQRYSNKTSSCYWTRQGPQFRIFSADLAVDDILEIHYYRRLPSLDSVYAVQGGTYNSGDQGRAVFTLVDGSVEMPVFDGNDFVGAMSGNENVLWFDGPGVDIEDGVNPTATAFDTPTSADFHGYQFRSTVEVPNWLRDENERILLFGALAELFAFVGEDDMQQKYGAMFAQEIEELNREEAMRMASGGNVKVNYNSHLI